MFQRKSRRLVAKPFEEKSGVYDESLRLQDFQKRGDFVSCSSRSV